MIDLGLTRKIAIVTGAGRGIGAAIVRNLHAAGCIVHATDLEIAGVEALADALGSRVHARQMDVRDPVAVRDAMAAIVDRCGRIDIQVNNAGLIATGMALETSEEQWDALLRTNMTGIFHCAKAVAPVMREHGGSIVNIASISAFKGGGTFGNVWYGATKAGVVAMTKGLARELGPWGVRVNAVAPSVAETEMVARQLTPEVRDRITPGFPLRRLASVDDVAHAVLFFASDLASFVTGETLAVDGGLLKT